MKKLSLLAVLFAALLIILLIGRTDSQTPLTANDLGQVQMPPQTVLGNTLPVTGPLNAVPFSQFTGAINSNLPTILPPVVNGDCLKFAAPNSFADAGAPCNTGGGGGGGTVFSVGQSVPTGLSVTGSPITTSGTLAINWNGTIPNAQIPAPTPTALGGIETISCAAGQFVNVINASGVPSCATPAGTVSTTGNPSTGQCAQFTGATTITGLATSCGLGTVTSVSATVPTGLAISGSPITTSGTLAFTWSGTIPNAQVPNPTVSALGGVESVTCTGGQFVNGINTSGVPGCATPAGGGNVSTSGTITSGNCAQWNSTTTLISASAPCGSGGSGATSFTDYINIKTYGATGDGTCHALSTAYGSLAAAQAVYPFVSDLTQCIDWAATQQAINVAFTSAALTNFSFSVYCPVGNFQLSNPIFFDQANNTQGSYAAYASGTTYANGANVTYNGIPWVSMGSGNVGNTPTSMAFYPNNFQIVNSGGGSIYPPAFPWATVQISNANPAVITPLLAGGSLAVVANQPIVFFTQQVANPNGGATPALPTGINANQVYYVVGSSISGGVFSVSTTPGGSAVATSSAGVGNFFASGQVWQVAAVKGSGSFSNRVSFIGSDAVGGQSGCRFTTQNDWTSPAIIVGPQNGNVIKNITLQGQVGPSVGANGYKCTVPFSNNSNAGAQLGSTGWAVVSNGGGSSKTLFENTSANGFYIGDWRGYTGTGELVDSNTWIKPAFYGNCINIYMNDTQAFINTVYDGALNNSNTNIFASDQEGIKVVGGNSSQFFGLGQIFTISSVSTSTSCANNFVICVVATISSPDNNLQSPMCAYSAGQAYTRGVKWLNAWPFASGCGYTTWVIKTAQWGWVGMYTMNYNPFTAQITLGVPQAYAGIYQGTCCGSNFATELAAATTIYAAESVIGFFGDVQVDTTHVENDNVPTTLSCFCSEFFGGARPAELKNVYMNMAPSGGVIICCNQTFNNQTTVQGIVQNVIPFINSTLGDTIIDYMSGGFNGCCAATSFSGGNMDRALIATETSTYVEGRHMMGNNNANISTGSGGNNGTSPLFDFANSAIGTTWLNTPPLINPGTLGQLSGGYYAMGGSAYGSGTWDNPSNFVSSAAFSVNASNQPVNQADLWRSRGWGQSPYWGVRPAPWASPCILPSQATSLAALPAITYVSNLQDFLHVSAGGTGYNNGDHITLAGGAGTAAVIFVTANTGGVITAVQVLSAGAYTTEASSFTQASTTGSGTGATFNLPIWYVNYTIGYPLLWGGHIYHACNYNDASFSGPKYAIKSTHTGWTYGQNLTTTNVPNLAWTMDGASPFINMNLEALELMFPGLVITLTGTGGCSGTYTGIVLETHASAGYIKTVGASADGSAYVPALAASGTTCTGTTIGQAAFALVNPY